MKRIMIMMLTVVAIAMPSSAQMTKKDTGNGPLSERVSKFWKKTKKTLDQAAEQVRQEFESSNSGLRKVNGEFTNIYKGDDVDELCRLCRKEFSAKYPHVDIRSCAIPQTDWQTETVKKEDKVTGYSQTLFCYIIGRDGNEGFINAKFVFERQKKVGDTVQTKVKWPLWIRTDVLNNEVYQKLITRE